MSLTVLDTYAHVYSFAWCDEDNPDQHLRIGLEPKWWRVFRYYPKHPSHPVTEPMSRAEAKAKCEDVIKLTGGRKLL
jgi:hypothetical protein